MLAQTEDALRRLLFEVRPPALEIPGGFEETIRDRVAMMRSLTGIEAELELELPDELPYEFKSMVFRQVSEALTNVEKHAAATRVQVSVRSVGRRDPWRWWSTMGADLLCPNATICPATSACSL